ncbi:MAG: diaminopimelate decarboxylase [Christensenellaceae bacterium]|jgi:diaminopimelate decarboxylase|nr:diaminopimelate decarboxylase [Christensenellaceae bacterium]
MKKCFLTLTKAKEIISEFPTPFHVYDEKGISDNARELYDAFSWNAGFKEYFAVKATPNPAIIRLLAKFGCGLDCSSLAELKMAEKLGFRGNEIMFSSNETSAEEYVLARKLDAIINLDDLTHIDFLDTHAGIPEKICLRFNPGGEFGTDKDIMGNPEEAKYGLTRAQLTQAVKKLKLLGVKEFGLHSFLASNTVGNDYYPLLARVMFTTVLELMQETGVKFTFVNLSGGIGIPYRPEQEKVDIYKVSFGVKQAYDSIFTANGYTDIKLFTELGRYMLAPYGGLVTTVIHFKHTYREYIGVDACAAHLMRPAIYGAYHHITVLGKETLPDEKVYDVVGSLCENSDKFAINRHLPIVDYGDILFIHDSGAHGHAMGYNYNGKLRSAEILLQSNGTFRLIRRAETLDDYFSTLDIYDEFKKS